MKIARVVKSSSFVLFFFVISLATCLLSSVLKLFKILFDFLRLVSKCISPLISNSLLANELSLTLLFILLNGLLFGKLELLNLLLAICFVGILGIIEVVSC